MAPEKRVHTRSRHPITDACLLSPCALDPIITMEAGGASIAKMAPGES